MSVGLSFAEAQAETCLKANATGSYAGYASSIAGGGSQPGGNSSMSMSLPSGSMTSSMEIPSGAPGGGDGGMPTTPLAANETFARGGMPTDDNGIVELVSSCQPVLPLSH